MSEFQANAFVDASASGGRSLMAMQETTGSYRPPVPAYTDQDLRPLLDRAPQSRWKTGNLPVVPAVRLDLYTVENGWFCVGNGLDGVVLTADRKMVFPMAMFSDPGRANTGDAVLRLPIVETIFNDVFVGFDAAWTNWYHWLCFALEHFHADWKSQSDVRPMKLLAEFELERFQSG